MREIRKNTKNHLYELEIYNVHVSFPNSVISVNIISRNILVGLLVNHKHTKLLNTNQEFTIHMQTYFSEFGNRRQNNIPEIYKK